MVRSRWMIAGALLAMAAVPAASASSQAAPEKPAGEGVLCALALYSAMAAIVHQCSPDAAPEVQAELRRQVERLEGYVLANGVTMPQLVAFKRDALDGLSDPQMCAAQRADGFESVLQANPDELRTGVDELIARPGTPTWGSCV